MFAENDESKKRPPFQIGQDLSDMSVHDLAETIEDLKAEITRLEADAKAKHASKSAADAFFKK